MSESPQIGPDGWVTPFAYRLRADNPSPMTFTGTCTWFVRDPDADGCWVVDPGPAGEHIDTIVATLERLNLTATAVIVTHDHPDHIEGAASLCEHLSAPFYSRRSNTLPDGEFRVGDAGPCWDVVSAPGHSSDSILLVNDVYSCALTGDVIFSHGPTVVYAPDGNLTEYFDTLDTLDRLVDERGITCFLPAHGEIITDPRSCIIESRAHRVERLDQIRAALNDGVPADPASLVRAVYGDLDVRLIDAAKRSVMAQLEYLVASDDPSLRR